VSARAATRSGSRSGTRGRRGDGNRLRRRAGVAGHAIGHRFRHVVCAGGGIGMIRTRRRRRGSITEIPRVRADRSARVRRRIGERRRQSARRVTEARRRRSAAARTTTA